MLLTMGLKCSLLGHDFGDPELEREREERGDEVVLISREVETCGRCGKSRVVSENKEITTVQPEEAVASDSAETDATEMDASEAGAPEVGAETGTGVDAGATGGASGLESAIEQVEADEELEPAPSPEEDDAVILDGEDEAAERDAGEWPEEAAGEVDEAEPDAQVEAAPDIAQAEAAATPESEPDTAHPDEDAEVWSGEMPGEESEPEPEAESESGPEPEAEPEPEPEPEISGPTISETSAVDVESLPADTMYCPECGFTEPIAGSSLRAGDACPECHQGYLERTE